MYTILCIMTCHHFLKKNEWITNVLGLREHKVRSNPLVSVELTELRKKGIAAMITHLRLKAYGKINLALDVLGRRDNGYHDVRMIMQTVGLHDRIELYRTKEPGIRLETNLFYLPNNEQNLAYRAAALLIEEFGVKEGVSIQLKKFIPVSAGMAGGSTDAAAVLFGVNKMFGLGLSIKELMERGVKLGADIPYCLMRGTALSEGIGEELTPLPQIPQCQVLIAKPGISVSTKVVYESLDAMELKQEDHPDIDGMCAAIRAGDAGGVLQRLGNVLEPVTAGAHPEINEIRKIMQENGAGAVQMSGSGPTVFGVLEDPAAGDMIAAMARARSWEAAVTETRGRVRLWQDI